MVFDCATFLKCKLIIHTPNINSINTFRQRIIWPAICGDYRFSFQKCSNNKNKTKHSASTVILKVNEHSVFVCATFLKCKLIIHTPNINSINMFRRRIIWPAICGDYRFSFRKCSNNKNKTKHSASTVILKVNEHLFVLHFWNASW